MAYQAFTFESEAEYQEFTMRGEWLPVRAAALIWCCSPGWVRRLLQRLPEDQVASYTIRGLDGRAVRYSGYLVRADAHRPAISPVGNPLFRDSSWQSATARARWAAEKIAAQSIDNPAQ